MTGLALVPGKLITVPPELEEHVKVLLTRYPNELIDGGAAQSDLQAKLTVIKAHEVTIAEQQKLIKNLQTLLAKDTGDSRVKANRRADLAEQQLDEAREKIASLEKALAASKTDPSLV